MAVRTVELNDSRSWQSIGRGGSGNVYSAIWTHQQTDGSGQQSTCSTKVAVKVVDGTAQVAPETEQQIQKELEVLVKLQHRNVIGFFGVTSHNHGKGLVLEYAEGGSLDQIINNNDKFYSVEDALRWMCEAADGISYLHSRKVIHRDLKPANFLMVPVTDSFILKVADFGISREKWTPTPMMTPNVGSFPYMAPEVIRAEKYDHRCDVFSFGIILWHVFSRQKPYQQYANSAQIIFAVGSKGERPQPMRLDNCPGRVQELFERCWLEKYEQRPAMGEVGETLLAIRNNLWEEERSRNILKTP